MLQLIRKEDQNEGANTEYAGAITTTPKTPTFAAGWIFCPCDVCVRHSKDTWHDLWDWTRNFFGISVSNEMCLTYKQSRVIIQAKSELPPKF